ncbi:hypothetical protein BKA62DRAFT_780337 [Auriculariales sp. MPI-PUGE-AT-0066]|nr:hypothetical protein BKA62DRAFT_780337 [Auriculariales sp. MPI-PUGE-AT-0066]
MTIWRIKIFLPLPLFPSTICVVIDDSRGGEPEFICYATASEAKGPWTNLGIGGPNVRKINGSYEMVVVGWQADWPSRGGRLHSPDGIAWSLDRSAMLLDIGIAGGVEDHMIYRQYIANVDGEDYYNTKNQRPSDWIETINVAIWRPNDNIIDRASGRTCKARTCPTAPRSRFAADGRTRLETDPTRRVCRRFKETASFAARTTLSSASVTPMDYPVKDRDNVVFARYTDRSNYYYDGIASWSKKYAIVIL